MKLRECLPDDPGFFRTAALARDIDRHPIRSRRSLLVVLRTLEERAWYSRIRARDLRSRYEKAAGFDLPTLTSFRRELLCDSSELANFHPWQCPIGPLGRKQNLCCVAACGDEPVGFGGSGI